MTIGGVTAIALLCMTTVKGPAHGAVERRGEEESPLWVAMLLVCAGLDSRGQPGGGEPGKT